MSAPPEQTPPVDSGDVFAHVLVEIDETPESLVAAAQAKCLCAPGSHLELLAVADTPSAVHAGAAATFVADHQRELATAALEHARNLFQPTSARSSPGSRARHYSRRRARSARPSSRSACTRTCG